MAGKKEDKKKLEEVSSSLPALSNSLQSYLAQIRDYPVLSREEEYELAMRHRETGDLEAARKLIVSNLKFVVRIANEYKNYNVNTLDLIQEGNIGLMKAVRGFDPTKGYRLISYAVWWIRAYIQNHIMKTWSLVKVGTNQSQRKLFYKLRSTKNKIEATGAEMEEDIYSEIAKELDVPDSQVIEMDRIMSGKDLSLDANIEGSTERTYVDMLGDTFDQEQFLEDSQTRPLVAKKIKEAMANLKEREKYIIERRILTDSPETLEKLSHKFGISRERVRQIEKNALNKIRKEFQKEHFHV
ncbi:MAG: RNA polymerase sigma factor RpoH [Candidatus Dadabacteria bacterium]|nr:RNA polymerase sigma factor RpoH [Candidatus Dadabacteria bacterium]MDE0519762.1 RNA polymerase sigma factor RpoH [Candidatus Dadabacteria bacterium]MDE0662701.1 RNA polymerase sigma factor RpoH [Candidatus Dadabacteria bacterium]